MKAPSALGAKITGGIGAATGAAGPGGGIRQPSAAIGADAVRGVFGDIGATVITFHDHSSFFFIIEDTKIKCKPKN